MDEEAEYGLVMPFVVCVSQGGVYDDESFVAGVRFGLWKAILTLEPTMHSNYEPKELVPQLDLLAMDRHYTITLEPWEESDDWVLVTMRR